MKNGTIRTLGAAALGVAFAAAAGSANAAETAAPAALPVANPATAVDGLTGKLPVQQTANLLPGAGTAAQTAQDTLKSLASPNGNGLLGGLPISSVTGALGAAGH
ncbi:hypothetical protein [Streptantibioticus ferralitis]|uniref:ATP-binding protein n=1 Tax=Streptantibioticus ferralitis TaxID=236510 RepID=A0ABT5Z1Y3_9ACTN|nr:hypothetical protein [Streptantibioticus ferralitis]MDF2257847.1 hypothetical protein [Streptantibioticus ferralitis]